MPTRLLLEGADLELLMTHVRADYGPDAVIVRAERVRTGGLGGFFAREHFELTIEVPDPEPLSAGWARARAAQRAARPPVPTSAAPPPVGLDALLDAADAAELGGPTEPAVPQLSTGGETFASVLDSVRSMAGGVPLGPVVPVDTPSPAPVAPAPPEPGDAALISAFEPLDAPSVAASSPSVVLRPPGAGRQDLLDLGVPAALLAGIPEGSGPVPLSDLLRALPTPPEPIRTPGTVIAIAGDAATVMTTVRQMMLRLGLTETDVVLAGDLEAVPGHGRRLQTAAAARRYRERDGAEPADGVTVVALGVGPEPADQVRAADLLEALRPDQAWAVVDARGKSRDVTRWLTTVGGTRRFDALAVTGAFVTSEPGTVLGLAVPVGWVDGLPATRVTWAAVLSRHLGEDARWD